MERYSYDFTKVAEANLHLYNALQNLAKGRKGDVKTEILTARELLCEYISTDPMFQDPDGEGGWIRARDTFDEEQMIFIRDIFAERLDDTTGEGGTIQDMLDVINVVQRATGCDEYQDLEHFRRSLSGSFAEISTNAI